MPAFDLELLPPLLSPYLFGGLLLLVRLAGLLVALPGLTTVGVPASLRVVLALSLTVILSLALGGVAVPVPEGPLSLGVMAVREVLIGAGLGLAIRLVLAAVEGAGAVASFNMALSLSFLVDPATEQEAMPLGALLALVGGMIFLALGGHHLAIETFFHHVRHFPVGQTAFSAPDPALLAEVGGDLIRTALLLAAPVVVVGFIINAGMAFVSRVVPSVNLFGIGLGALLAGGFWALGAEGDAILVHLAHALELLPERMVELSGAAP